MPFPFVLPTTSAFSFSNSFGSSTHPSLPLAASTHRAVVRDTLKSHKRLPPAEQAANLTTVQAALEGYLPYLFTLDQGFRDGGPIRTVLKKSPVFLWRTINTEPAIPRGAPPRVKLPTLEYEIVMVATCLACTQVLRARAALHSLYSSATASPSVEQRVSAINTATRHLLAAASIHQYLGTRTNDIGANALSVDVHPSSFQSFTSLALAEATLLAVLKDDPYPAAVAQDRNKNDKEWMIKPPEMPQVRAHLFARLCIAAADHGDKAGAALSRTAGAQSGMATNHLILYITNLRNTARAKAFRFFAIDAEMRGDTGNAIAWCMAGNSKLGYKMEESGSKGLLSLSRMKKDFAEKRNDRRVEQEGKWGSDGGRTEEGRVLDMLIAKWTKMNDTINTQIIPPFTTLISQMPSGREIHTLPVFNPPSLDAETLRRMQAPPDRIDEAGEDSSSDEDAADPVGAFPGTKDDCGKGRGGLLR